MKIIELGLIPYSAALEIQLTYVEKAFELNQDFILVCSHPPVVTKGRATKPEDIGDWSGEIVEVSRGGRATYHGPSQLIVYPILNLIADRAETPPRDIHKVLRKLEEACCETLNSFGISAKGQNQSEDLKNLGLEGTGVWIQQRKLASVGIAVKKWITYHGLALNVDYDPRAHFGIQPCGFNIEQMTSVEEELGSSPNRELIKSRFLEKLSEKFRRKTS